MSLLLKYVAPLGLGTVYFNGNDDGNNSPYRAILGATGFLAPPYTVIEAPVPANYGGVTRGAYEATRILTIPILVSGTSFANMWANMRTLTAVCSPSVLQGAPFGYGRSTPEVGAGTLIATAPDGDIRYLAGSFVAGMEGILDDTNFGPNFLLFAAEFHAPHPYWINGASTVTDTRSNIVSGAGDVHSVTTACDAAAECTWSITFTVPASTGAQTLSITLVNAANGYTFSMAGIPIASTSGSPVNHTIALDWRRGSRSFTLDGVSIAQYIGLTSTSWRLVPALANSLTYIITGSVAINSTIGVNLVYQNTWNTL